LLSKDRMVRHVVEFFFICFVVGTVWQGTAEYLGANMFIT
jgi:hypothetical protein